MPPTQVLRQIKAHAAENCSYNRIENLNGVEAMSHYHVVVWLDHRSAHVLHLGRDDVEALRVHPKGSAHLLEHAKHIHHRTGTRTGNHAPDNPIYFNDVVAALGDAHDWLIVAQARPSRTSCAI